MERVKKISIFNASIKEEKDRFMIIEQKLLLKISMLQGTKYQKPVTKLNRYM